MESVTKQWRSPSLGRDMEIKIYGERGTPILALPTRNEDCNQWEEKGMIEAIEFQLDNGFNQLFTVGSIDEESFFNDKVEPGKRLLRHRQFETFLTDEIVPFIKQQNNIDYLIIAGTGMGGYHAVNLALKNPREFGKALGISGVYDIKQFFGDYYSDEIYYNNPVDYLPNLNNEQLLNKIRQVDFRITSYADDPGKGDAYKMADALRKKGIDHQLDIWDLESDEAWDLWKQMLKIHIV